MWAFGRRTRSGVEPRGFRAPAWLVVAGALALGGCQTEKQTGIAAAQPRGATVAFESIDGLPHDRFSALVQDLNGEAQSRRLAVLSREQSTAYRVRGYFAAAVERGRTTISWVWDVFDDQEHRAYRISGTEDGTTGKAWAAVDNAMLQRIASSSMEQLAAFLTSPAVAPGTPTPDNEPRVAFSGDDSTPEAAGIFRVSHAEADPLPAAAATQSADVPVPMPPKRPGPVTAAVEPMTRLAAIDR